MLLRRYVIEVHGESVEEHLKRVRPEGSYLGTEEDNAAWENKAVARVGAVVQALDDLSIGTLLKGVAEHVTRVDPRLGNLRVRVEVKGG